MNTNIIHELKKFLNNPAEITLEFTFSDFESTVFKGVQTIKNLTTKKTSLTISLVKNKNLGSVIFFFKDGPTYQFALTVEEANLYNDNNSNENLISKFIVLGNDPIRGTQLKISSDKITIYACFNDNKPRGLESLSFNQIYSDCTSVKRYNYALGIETLKKPTNIEPNYSPNNNSKGSNKFLILGIVIIIVFCIIIMSNININRNNTNFETNEFETDTISIDTTASLPEISEFWIEKEYQNFSYSIPESMKLIESQSNENLQVIVDEDNSIGITISHSILPDGQENETISSLINGESHQFALSTNDENRKNFSDFQLIDYDFVMLGNMESFLVTQSSTELSGKNISMILKSYFVISSPNYYSISLSYPENSASKEEVINRIVDSFKFNISELEEDNKTSEVTSVDDNVYSVITNRAYFYSHPDENSKTKVFVVYNDIIYAESEKSDFIYSVYLNKNGNKTKGWLLKSNLFEENQN